MNIKSQKAKEYIDKINYVDSVIGIQPIIKMATRAVELAEQPNLYEL